MPFHSREPTQFFYRLTSDKKQVYEPKIFEHATFSNVEKKFDRPYHSCRIAFWDCRANSMPIRGHGALYVYI